MDERSTGLGTLRSVLRSLLGIMEQARRTQIQVVEHSAETFLFLDSATLAHVLPLRTTQLVSLAAGDISRRACPGCYCGEYDDGCYCCCQRPGDPDCFKIVHRHGVYSGFCITR